MLGGLSVEQLYEKVSWLHGATRFGSAAGIPDGVVPRPRPVRAAAG
jgi:hypothetical protein